MVGLGGAGVSPSAPVGLPGTRGKILLGKAGIEVELELKNLEPGSGFSDSGAGCVAPVCFFLISSNVSLALELKTSLGGAGVGGAGKGSGGGGGVLACSVVDGLEVPGRATLAVTLPGVHWACGVSCGAGVLLEGVSTLHPSACPGVGTLVCLGLGSGALGLAGCFVGMGGGAAGGGADALVVGLAIGEPSDLADPLADTLKSEPPERPTGLAESAQPLLPEKSEPLEPCTGAGASTVFRWLETGVEDSKGIVTTPPSANCNCFTNSLQLWNRAWGSRLRARATIGRSPGSSRLRSGVPDS